LRQDAERLDREQDACSAERQRDGDADRASSGTTNSHTAAKDDRPPLPSAIANTTAASASDDRICAFS
jgi:hypothetical protein